MPHLSGAGASLLNVHDPLPKVVALISLHSDQPQRAPDLARLRVRAQADQAGVCSGAPCRTVAGPACSCMQPGCRMLNMLRLPG